MTDLKKPPMGWNSYDYYDTTVNEAQVKKNADYMAKNLLHRFTTTLSLTYMPSGV